MTATGTGRATGSAVRAKRAAAEAAVRLAEPGCRLALGTGSTVEQCLPGLAAVPGLTATPTSTLIADRARAAGITLVPVRRGYDLYLDGADQVAPSGAVVKGSWGAHVREKLLAALARRRVLVCDDTKLVPRLVGPVPVAVVPYFAGLYGDPADIRLDDNGLALIGFDPGRGIDDPTGWNATVERMPGVVCTGLFDADFVHQITVGHPDGSVELRHGPAAES